MITNSDIIDTITKVKRTETALDLLLDFEEILDNLHVFAYKNWIEGEVIKGPIIKKYWITVYLMYPAEKMPNPDAASRLTSHGCKVYFKKDKFKVSFKPVRRDSDPLDHNKNDEQKIIDINDKKVQKEVPVYIVKIVMPRHLLKTLNDNEIMANKMNLELEGEQDE